MGKGIIWIKLVLIGLASLIGFFGLSSVFKFKTEPTGLTQSPTIQNMTNETIGWVKRAPLKDFFDLIFSGVSGVVKWLSSGINMFFTWLIKLISPTAVIPSWLPAVVILFLFTFLFWKGLDTLYDWGHGFGKILLLISGIVLAIALLLIFLKLI